jgi:transcription initiation factor IIE alpha subunit/energy-coupling factor transporter ATP-binding protein EcfA2
MSIRLAASVLYELGFNVVPVDASKKPLVSWSADKRLDWKELEEYLRKASGIAITGRYLEDTDYGTVIFDLDSVHEADEILSRAIGDWRTRLCGQGWSLCGLTGPRPKGKVTCNCNEIGEDCDCVIQDMGEHKRLSELERGMYIIVRVNKNCIPGGTIRGAAIEVMVNNYEVVYGKHPSGVYYQPVAWNGEQWVPVDIENVGQGEVITCDDLNKIISELTRSGATNAATSTGVVVTDLPEPTRELSEEEINKLVNLAIPIWKTKDDAGKNYHDRLLFGVVCQMRRAGIKYEVAKRVAEAIIEAGVRAVMSGVDEDVIKHEIEVEKREHIRETVEHVYGGKHRKPDINIWGRQAFEETLRPAVEKAIEQGLLQLQKPEDWFRAVYEALGLRQSISLPDRVVEGEERRFVAEKSFDYDNRVFSVVIREVGNESNVAKVSFSLEVVPPIDVYVRYSVYDTSDEEILGGRKFKVKRVMKAVRSALSTKAIRNHGPIANYLRLVYRLVVGEAREYARGLRQKAAEELRKNEEFLANPLRYVVTNVLSKVHYGDEIAKKTCFLAMVTSWLPASNRVNCAVIGPSSSGKSTLLNALYECMPRRKVLGMVVITSSSPKAIFYEGKMVREEHAVRHILKARHKVIFFAEPTVFYGKSEGEALARELFKLILSDAEDGRLLCHKAVDPDKKITRYYCLDGKPVLISTIPNDYLSRLSDQEYARLLTTSVDTNPEVDKEVFEFLLNETPQRKIEFEQEALLISSFLVLLPIVESIELSDAAKEAVRDTLGKYLLDEKSTRHIRRALRDLVGLAAAYDLLYYTAGLIREGREVPTVLDKLTVSSEAVHYVWDLVKDSMEAKVYAKPLVKEENLVYKFIKEAGRPVRRAEIVDALAKYVSQSTIDKTLRGLVEEERIMRCRQGVYALPDKCPGTEKITKYAGEEQQQSVANQGVQGNGDRGGGS